MIRPMRTLLSSSCCCISLLAVLAAQDPGAADPRGIGAAWRAFVDGQRPATFHVEWSPAAGTPAAIFGAGLRVAGPVRDAAHARDVARGVLDRFAALLGRGRSTFALTAEGKVHRTHVLVYEQRFGGLTVVDGRADVRLNDAGVVAMFGSIAFAIPAELATAPVVSSEAAQLTAVTRLDVRDAAPAAPRVESRLVIWADRRQPVPCAPRLAWEVGIRSSGTFGRAYVDATTGAFIQFRDDVYGLRSGSVASPAPRHAAPDRRAARRPSPPRANVQGTVMAWVSEAPGPNGALVNRPLGGLRVQVQGGGSGFTDGSGRFDIPHAGTQPVNVSFSFANNRRVGAFTSGGGAGFSLTTPVTPGTPRTIQVYTSNATAAERAQSTAYYLVDRVNEYVRQAHILNNNANLARLDQIAVDVNSTNVSCNASYSGNRILFGAGGQCPNMAFSTVVEHEWGHGLDEVFGGISTQDGLSEAWADVVANYYTGQPIIGKDFQGPGQHVRDATNTRAFGTGSTPHEQGESFMGACWKARQALAQKLGQAAGVRHAETIVLGSILANASTQPAAAREIFLLDDNDGNLNNGTPNCRELFQAFTTVHKIPSPVRTCSANPGAFTAFGAGCPGSGRKPSVCQGQNTTGGGFVPPPPPGTELAYGLTAAATTGITAVSLYVQATVGPASDTVALHRDAGGQPAATAAATGSLSVAAGPGWYRAQLTATLNVSSNERLWIVHGTSRFSPALLVSGTPASVGTLARHPIFSPSWGPLPLPVDIPAWQLECTGGGANAVPGLSSPGVPEIGFPFTVDLDFARPNAAAMLHVGLSNTQLGGIRLPLDLAILGAPGCNLLTSLEVLAPLRTDASGRSSLSATLPNDRSAVGKVVYLQASVVDAPANALGVAFTGGAAAKIGTR